MSAYTTAILLLGGEGKRFNHSLPKQFHRLSGKKIYLYALEAFLSCAYIDAIILVVHPQFQKDVLSDITPYQHKLLLLAEGKASRQLSCFSGLKACPKATTHVIIHDGVRPFVTVKIIEENIYLAKSYGACDTCTASYDTIVHSKDQYLIHSIPPRSEYLRGQTPQSFELSLLLQAHKQAQKEGVLDATDDCQLVLRLEKPVMIAQGSDENIKITTEYDLLLAEQILRLQMMQQPLEATQKLENKVYVVTGASGGIGSAIVQALQKQGATCIELSKSGPLSIDLSQPELTKKTFANILHTYQHVDGLINAAGYLALADLKDLSDATIQELINSNFLSMVYSCKYCPIKKGGHILNFSSSSYTRGRPHYILYSAMKAAVVNFTQGLALERPEYNINCIAPSRTLTPMRTKNFPYENSAELLDSSVIAEEVVRILKCESLTGLTVEIKKK
jgi:2-C-methyl-D-erythritol 4-phosphate cytidylyltransferase